ncbi:hypothetical protein [Pantoea ananatis]|uniref:hypothetical protein n=1 Tax=Pantoea ananas TaxID=553 RepID=UPI001B300449|nr:hypothetical protein [Pantoea ananatis]
MEWEEFKLSISNIDLNGIDSEYTFSTRNLVAHFKAQGAHLNKWWVMTPVDWICPCCKRRKSEIVRLNKHNYLTCQLHEHHDHMKEVVKSIFEDLSTKRDAIVADELSEKFAIKASFALSAYDNTIICFDCNKADADAKRLVKCHKFFSFSPKEISEFVCASPNSEHRIDSDKAVEVWQRVEPIFLMRLKLAQQLAEIASEKKDWYQPSARTAKQTERVAKWFLKFNGISKFTEFEPEKLLYNTEPFRGEKNSWRIKKVAMSTKTPTDNDIAHLSAVRGRYWNKYDQEWTCPCCFRNKRSCVRSSKKNQWVMEIKKVPLFYQGNINGKINEVAMCMDCVDSAINLGREVSKMLSLVLEFPSSVVTLQELSQVIIARPHSKHSFKNEAIEDLLLSICKRN